MQVIESRVRVLEEERKASVLHREVNYQECTVNPYILESLITIGFGVKQPDYVAVCLHVHVCVCVFYVPDLLPAKIY